MTPPLLVNAHCSVPAATPWPRPDAAILSWAVCWQCACASHCVPCFATRRLPAKRCQPDLVFCANASQQTLLAPMPEVCPAPYLLLSWRCSGPPTPFQQTDLGTSRPLHTAQAQRQNLFKKGERPGVQRRGLSVGAWCVRPVAPAARKPLRCVTLSPPAQPAAWGRLLRVAARQKAGARLRAPHLAKKASLKHPPLQLLAKPSIGEHNTHTSGDA